MNCSKILSHNIKNGLGIFIRIALNLQVNLWRIDYRDFLHSQPEIFFSSILMFFSKGVSHILINLFKMV